MQQCLPPHSDPPYVNDEHADLNPSSPAIEEKKIPEPYSVSRVQSGYCALNHVPKLPAGFVFPHQVCAAAERLERGFEAQTP